MFEPLKVVEFPTINLNDIPAKLENLAARVRDGQEGDVTRVVVITQTSDNKHNVFGFGDTGQRVVALGLLTLAIKTVAEA